MEVFRKKSLERHLFITPQFYDSPIPLSAMKLFFVDFLLRYKIGLIHTISDKNSDCVTILPLPD